MERSEKEIIDVAKEMLSNGLGSTYVYKWVRDRVADPAIRERIMSQVNNTSGDVPKKDQDQLKKERALRNAKFLNEDILDSINKSKYVGYLAIGLGLTWIIVHYFVLTEINYLHLVNIGIGGIVLALISQMDMRNKSLVGLIAAIFLILLLIEFLIFGMPGRLIPNLGETRTHKLINIITIANDLTPILYFFLQAFVSYTFFKTIHLLGKWKKLPGSIRDHFYKA